MTGVEVALLIVLSVAVIALIVTMVLVLRRLGALSTEATQLLQTTRQELADTMQEIRNTSKNISDTSNGITDLAGEITFTVGHLNRVLDKVEKFDPAEAVASAAGKATHAIGINISSLFSGIKEAFHSYRHPQPGEAGDESES